MARERPDLLGSPLGLVDTETGQKLHAENVIDITADCPSKKKPLDTALLLYGTSSQGPLVQVWDGNEDGSICITVRIREDGNSRTLSVDFPYLADQLGHTPATLYQLILFHAPEVSVAKV